MSTDASFPASRNERFVLREYAAAGEVPRHSHGMLFSLGLVRKVARDRARMVEAMAHIREHPDD
jgi:hypothetical protein